ncbi:MAG: type III-A CRISPR-associated RAMP protein Csm4 [bacterium]
MKTYRVTLTPKGTMSKIPDSQTLFGAFCWAYLDLYGEKSLEELLDNYFAHDDKFVVSSAFPNGFLPAPLFQWYKTEDIDKLSTNRTKFEVMSKLKKFKKVKYVTENLFDMLLMGDISVDVIVKDIIFQRNQYSICGNVLGLDYEDLSLSISSQNSFKNSINRLSNTTGDGGNLYYFNTVNLNRGSKLFFFMSTDNIDKYLPVFNLLSHGAIGGDRSSGNNNFQVELDDEFDPPVKDDRNWRVLLSKYIPKNIDKEIDKEKSLCKIDTVHSKVENRMFKVYDKEIIDIFSAVQEGSIIYKKESLLGHLKIRNQASKKFEHNVYYNGIAFLYPLEV